MNRIRIQFSIEWYGQNKVLYGPKHGLYRKNLCQTLFRHETSFPSSKIHETWTIWIGKPFSIDLNDQNQVPIGPNRGLWRILSKNRIFSKKIKKKKKQKKQKTRKKMKNHKNLKIQKILKIRKIKKNRKIRNIRNIRKIPKIRKTRKIGKVWKIRKIETSE